MSQTPSSPEIPSSPESPSSPEIPMPPETPQIPLSAGQPALLAADRITARFAHGPDVLAGASIQITAGRRLALLGANGSGKTTLLRCLSGALKPREGTILLGGRPLAHSREGLRHHRARVQLVGQNPDDQLFSADVTQDVSFGPLNLGLSDAEAADRVAEALEALGITHLAERPTHQLSYGERKRVAIAGAVALRPEVLLLDEPTAGLDPAGIEELLVTLGELAATVVLATHDVDLALRWADEIAIVADHRVRHGGLTLLADTELLHAARLRAPWQVQLTDALGLRPASGDLPRTVTEVAALITGAGA